MAFKDFPEQQQGVQLLQRSLERGRLGHAYLFAGHQLSELESLARTLAKTLNCQQPVRAGAGGPAIDCCDACLGCRKIDHDNHADVFWVRPESKLRQIKIGQLVRRDHSPSRVLLDVVNLKPTEAEYKVSIVVAADRMNEQAANSFLKTLEEPPPKSILILLSTDPQRLLETILSRCLRLNFAGADHQRTSPEQLSWLSGFGELAAAEQRSLLDRYRLLGVLVKKLNELRAQIEEALKARSPLTRYEDAEKDLREQWEDELAAAIEAEYRRQRADLLVGVQMWLRDVWVQAIGADGDLLHFPGLNSTAEVAGRITPEQATENLGVLEQTQRLLGTNVQEALALEVGLLKLHL